MGNTAPEETYHKIVENIEKGRTMDLQKLLTDIYEYEKKAMDLLANL